MVKSKKTAQVVLTETILLLALLIQNACADTEVINIKSDSTWKASSSISSTDWFKLDFDDSNWGNSAGRWPNNPCVKYCGKMNSCELTCVDWMWYNKSCENCDAYFRKTINLPDEVMSATITITADNYYWLYVNNNFVGSDTTKTAYQKLKTYDVTRYLLPGKNVISIKAQNENEFEGVALTGEIKYKTYDTLVNQLQTEIDGLEQQLNSLSNDKNRLQSQVDLLQQQNRNLTAAKDYFTAETSRLSLENLELKNTKSRLEQTLLETQSGLDTHRALNMVLILGLLITFAALIATLYYFYNKMKGRRPRLSEPLKRTPTEKMASFEKEVTHLSEEKTEAVPVFERRGSSRLSSLSGRED